MILISMNILLILSGTLHRIKIRQPLEFGDEADGPSDQPANHIEVEDVFLNDDITVEPVDMENIRDMTTTMQRKRSVRYIHTYILFIIMYS